MGCLSRHDERPADRTGQADRDQTGQGRRNLAAVDGKVPDLGDRAVGEGRLQDISTDQGSRRRDRGRHTCNASPLEGTVSVRGLGFSLIYAQNAFNE